MLTNELHELLTDVLFFLNRHYDEDALRLRKQVALYRDSLYSRAGSSLGTPVKPRRSRKPKTEQVSPDPPGPDDTPKPATETEMTPDKAIEIQNRP